MNTKPVEAVKLPPHLARTTIANARTHIDTPHYISPESICLREETGELYLRGGDQCPQGTQHVNKSLGYVGVMSANITDAATGKFVSGFVADLRHVNSANGFSEATCSESPSHPERREAWEADRQHEIPIAAVATEGLGEGEVIVCGDKRFAEAVLHLVALSSSSEEWLASRGLPKREALKESSSARYRRTGTLL